MTNDPSRTPGTPSPGPEPSAARMAINPAALSPEHLSIGARLAARPHPSSAAPVLNTKQIDVLRRIATDGNFRASFVSDPMTALRDARIELSSQDLATLTRLSPAQFGELADITARVRAESDGTHTLVYAVVLAVAFAAVMA